MGKTYQTNANQCKAIVVILRKVKKTLNGINRSFGNTKRHKLWRRVVIINLSATKKLKEKFLGIQGEQDKNTIIMRVFIILCSGLNTTRGIKTEEMNNTNNKPDTQVCVYIINTE